MKHCRQLALEKSCASNGHIGKEVVTKVHLKRRVGEREADVVACCARIVSIRAGRSQPFHAVAILGGAPGCLAKLSCPWANLLSAVGFGFHGAIAGRTGFNSVSAFADATPNATFWGDRHSSSAAAR